MAHKTLIDSTEHEITGGVTLVDGTSYSVKNGKVLVGGAEYDISFLLPPAALDLWGDDENCTITCITHANGYYVVGGQYHSDTYYARIAYATSLDGTWTIKDLWSGNDSIITCITYVNGYWVVGGKFQNGSQYFARISWTTDLPRSWSYKMVWGNSYNANIINCITYANGYWVVGGKYRNSGTIYARIAYATALDGTWTQKNLWQNSSDNAINGIAYGDGFWMMVGQRSGYEAVLTYTTDLSSSGWTAVTLWSNSGAYGNSHLTCVTSANGGFVVGGIYFDGAYYYGRIAYSKNSMPTIAWEVKDVWRGVYSPGGINSITYDKGHWVVAGYKRNADSNEGAYIAYATSLDGPWTEQELWLTTDNNYLVKANCVAYLNGYWVVGGNRYDSSYYAHLEYSPSLEGFNDIGGVGGDIPPATMISFTIDGTLYNAEEGMTWYEWANSSYNTTAYTCAGDDDTVISGINYIHYEYTEQYGRDSIAAGRAYRSTNEPIGGGGIEL